MQIRDRPNVEITSIIGEDAKAAGLGGICKPLHQPPIIPLEWIHWLTGLSWSIVDNVGRASTIPPRLVILKWTPCAANNLPPPPPRRRSI